MEILIIGVIVFIALAVYCESVWWDSKSPAEQEAITNRNGGGCDDRPEL